MVRGIPILICGDINDPAVQEALPTADLGVALNFDQVLKHRLFRHSFMAFLTCMPRSSWDKGVSPALWAFARGDAIVWITIYRMSEQLDCGSILNRFLSPLSTGRLPSVSTQNLFGGRGYAGGIIAGFEGGTIARA